MVTLVNKVYYLFHFIATTSNKLVSTHLHAQVKLKYINILKFEIKKKKNEETHKKIIVIRISYINLFR